MCANRRDVATAVKWARDRNITPVVPRNRARQDQLFTAMSKFGNGGSYQNFADPALQDFAKAYYGRNLERLTKVKCAYDPGNFFKFAQSIAPAA